MLYDLGILQFIAPPLTRHRGAMLQDVVITETDTAIIEIDNYIAAKIGFFFGFKVQS